MKSKEQLLHEAERKRQNPMKTPPNSLGVKDKTPPVSKGRGAAMEMDFDETDRYGGGDEKGGEV
ncbi:MAG TPA: hypothetical protein GXX40_01350 [Firmicutes bacterium]|nr:hypothetical protein [Bacillota bacterium]